MLSDYDKNNINLRQSQLTLAVFAATVALVMALVYVWITVNFQTAYLPLLNTLSVSFFLIFFPQGYYLASDKLQWLKRLKTIDQSWLTTEAALSLFALVILVICGLISALLQVNLMAIFLIVGLGLAILFYVKFFRDSKWLRNIRFLIISSLIGGWFAAISFASLWRNPFLKEWLMIDPISLSNMLQVQSTQLPDDSLAYMFQHLGYNPAMQDQLFHASVLNMIKTYGVITTGLDGIPYVPYHVGSHWIFAQLSNLIHLGGLQFYQLGFPIIIIPFFFQSLLSFSFSIRQLISKQSYCLKSDLLYWLIFFLAYITLIPFPIHQDILPWWHKIPQSLNSESYTLSIALSFIVFSLLLTFFRQNKANLLDFYLFIIIFPLLITLIGFIKISTAFLLLITTLYFLLRLKLYKNKLLVLSLGMAFILSFAVYLITAFSIVSPLYSEKTILLNIVRNRTAPPWQPFFFLIHFFWSCFFIVFKLYDMKIKTISDIYKAFIERKILDVELIMIFTFLGIFFVTFVNLYSNEFYFSDFQTWVALSLLLTTTHQLNQSIRSFWYG